MIKAVTCTLALLASVYWLPLQAKEAQVSDAEIVQRLIDASIAGYSGACPCPYNTARNGSRCGKRSAYNRAGGYTPLCYEEDVSKSMVQDYRKRMKL
ncbi:hypothetical protein RRX38_03035 [Pseudomonas sp. DTU_2021_1001937_2_SI_NGA_ILE_001]|uniref:hypothetical protein n=1 Tax=Pseudomonas sp. DTU_2021_1001937_2_SI_NGA_ILE_001 TaxID=3077589 RepID=UPI0028FC19FD|nr:hypothetical protein [Pseudomonas sp. DTU_2021_1001937_2_SI_NGA_ILE_001]WNW10165.1 hypothetical protein RRX38_03035 [Pseudomonas sp. DTU_2021_1001937_2_SI_NGA_ILE_001]